MHSRSTQTTARSTAFVTGASSGIGEAFARRLASEGYDLVLVARRQELLQKLADELVERHGVGVTVVAADLSNDAGAGRVADLIAATPRVGMLVNSAGFGTRGLYADVDPGKSGAMIYLHTVAMARLTRAALPAMIAGGAGSIVNVSSIGAFYTAPHYVSYSATKAFVNMFCLGLGQELRGTGVRVQALCPGLTRTGFMHTEEYREFSYEGMPSFAWMTPDAVVEESLRGLARGKTIMIAGRMNRAFIRTMTAPLIGPVFNWLLGKLAAGKY